MGEPTLQKYLKDVSKEKNVPNRLVPKRLQQCVLEPRVCVRLFGVEWDLNDKARGCRGKDMKQSFDTA